MHKRIKIGDLILSKKAHSQTGPFGTQLKASEYVEEGVPVINVRNIGMGEIRNKDLEFISDEKATELKSHSLRESDIVFGRKGAVERHSFITKKEEGWIQGSDCIRLRFLTNEINPKFISYFFRTQTHQQWMINLGSFGATMGSLNQEIISKIQIPDIKREKQDQIATILSAYDDLIENNNQRIRLLEEMAEDIYKEWFVRMRFPGYQECKYFDRDGHEVPHGSTGALPAGWVNGKLVDITTIEMGQSPKSENYNSNSEGLPFHQGVTNFNHRYPEHSIYCTDAKKIAEPEDILLSVRAPVGRLNIADRKLIIGRGLCAIKHVRSQQSFILYLLKDIFRVEDSYGNGAVFNAVSKSELLNIKIVVPDSYLQDKFQALISPLDQEIFLVTKKTRLLQETKNLLLPRLLTGKLDVERLSISQAEFTQ